jgi:hypothetical protein
MLPVTKEYEPCARLRRFPVFRPGNSGVSQEGAYPLRFYGDGLAGPGHFGGYDVLYGVGRELGAGERRSCEQERVCE